MWISVKHELLLRAVRDADDDEDVWLSTRSMPVASNAMSQEVEWTRWSHAKRQQLSSTWSAESLSLSLSLSIPRGPGKSKVVSDERVARNYFERRNFHRVLSTIFRGYSYCRSTSRSKKAGAGAATCRKKAPAVSNRRGERWRSMTQVGHRTFQRPLSK